jgi:hypothetical protein
MGATRERYRAKRVGQKSKTKKRVPRDRVVFLQKTTGLSASLSFSQFFFSKKTERKGKIDSYRRKHIVFSK